MYATFWHLLARDSGTGRARGALRAWDLWERVSEWIWPIQPIPGTSSGVLRMRLVRHRGPVIRLDDGTTVHPGATIARLHLDGAVAAAVTADTPWRIERLAITDLQALATWIAQLEASDRPVALYGRTLLGRGARRVGFDSSPCPISPALLLFRFYLHGLMVLHSREGWRRMRKGRVRSAPCSDIWMSTHDLLHRYGPAT